MSVVGHSQTSTSRDRNFAQKNAVNTTKFQRFNMAAWFFGLPVVWMAGVIFATTYLVAAAVFWCATRLWANNRSHLPDRGILSPIGVVFGLLVVFTAAEVGGNLAQASNAVTREASALREVVLLTDSLPQEEAAKLRVLITRHIKTAVTEEWPAMAEGR